MEIRVTEWFLGHVLELTKVRLWISQSITVATPDKWEQPKEGEEDYCFFVQTFTFNGHEIILNLWNIKSLIIHVCGIRRRSSKSTDLFANVGWDTLWHLQYGIN